MRTNNLYNENVVAMYGYNQNGQAYSANPMNENVMGGYVNEELVQYLEYGFNIFKRSDDINGIFAEKEDIFKCAESNYKRIDLKWKLLPFISGFVTWMILGEVIKGTVGNVLSIIFGIHALAGTLYLKQKMKPADYIKKGEKLNVAAVDYDAVAAEKNQMDEYIVYAYSAIPEGYRDSKSFEYMLKLAKAGRVMSMNEAYRCVDEENLRQEMLRQQKEAQEEQTKAINGVAATVGAVSIIGGTLGIFKFFSRL